MIVTILKRKRTVTGMEDRIIIRRSQHRCVKCGIKDERTLKGQWYCDFCAAKRRYYQTKYNKRQMERYYERKLDGVCTMCGGERDNNTLLCNSCREKQAAAIRRYWNKEVVG